MKNHIIKAVAVMMAVFMLMGTVPASALPVLAFGTSDATADTNSGSIFDNVVLGKDTVTNTESYTAGATITDPAGKTIVDSTYSPYEPTATNDPNHPFLPGNAAWIDLKQIYYGAPATQNYPLTAWSANTSVYNITGTGEKYDASYEAKDENGNTVTKTGGGDGKDKFAFEDLNLIDEYLWAGKTVGVYKNYEIPEGTPEADIQTDTDGKKYVLVSQNGIATSENDALKYVDADSDGNREIDMSSGTNILSSVASKNDTEACVYNRYDAMQGKWGLTLDKNVKSVTWSPNYQANYYGSSHLNTSYLYLTDTPYLYFSTEALDSTQIAISLLIGTPVQSEKSTRTVADGSNNLVQTDVTRTTEFVYRWYTITDNELRPGIDKDGDGINETLDYDMTPNVHVSDIVMENNLEDQNNSLATTLGYIANGGYTSKDWGMGGTKDLPIYENVDRLDPIALAEKDGYDTEKLYVNGSITGCIDFTNILPLLTAETVPNDSMAGNGRNGVRYRIMQMRVDTKTATDENGDPLDDSAFRINYLYFGPALSTVYTPQNTVGNEVNAANWQYAANTPNDGYGNGVADANNVALYKHVNDFGTTYSSSYTNGWENGAAVSVTNTPNDPQKLTIDTYGQGDGQLIISEDDEITSTTNGDKTEYSSFAITNSFATSFTDQNVNENGTLSRIHGIWTYTDVNGENVKLEAIRNGTDGDWYVSVAIPIRKWVDVLGNSRKLSYTLTMERYAEALTVEKNGVASDQKRNDAYIEPNFTLWGNDDGALGAGHAYFGARYKNEDMICVFGEEGGYYQSDRQTGYTTQLIDATIGESVIYNEPALQTLYSVVPAANNTYTLHSGQYYEYVDANGNSYYKNADDGKFYTGGSFKDAGGSDVWAYVQPKDETHELAWYCYDPAKNKLFTWGGTLVEDYDLSQYIPGYVFEEATVNDWALTPVCTTTESWFDLLRSPYTLSGNRVALGTNTNTGVGVNQRGYMFVTALRVVVPLGAVMSFQNMKGDGNSAGLNMYSTEGHIVNAYDGGTGLQPNIDLNGTIKEYTANSGSGTKANGDAKGTLRSDASAYGPFINSSYYTIYDLLDTEELNKKKSDGNAYGSRDLTMYGVPYTATENNLKHGNGTKVEGLPIYSHPYGLPTWYESSGTFSALKNGVITTGTVNSTIIGRIPAGTGFIVYGRISMLHVDSNEKTASGEKEVWGLVGVLKENAIADVGWVQLAAGKSTTYATQEVYPDRTPTFQFAFDGYNGDSKDDPYTYSRYTYDFALEQSKLLKLLNGKWLFSNASEGYGAKYYYRDGYDSTVDDETKNVAVSATSPSSFRAGDLVMNVSGTYMPALMFANMDRSTYNTVTNSSATNIKTQNTTDMQFNISDSTGWQAAGISRTLTTPIQLKITPSGDEKTWPVLYYDFDVPTSNTACRIFVTMNVNGTLKVYYVSPSGLSESQHSYWGSTTTSYCGYLSFKDIMSNAGYNLGEFPSTGGDNNTEVIQVLGVNLMLTESVASTLDIRRLEVWQDETAYLDKLYVESGAKNSDNGVVANAKIADGFNIINDAFYYVHDEDNDSNNSYKKNNSNKGWSGSVRLYDENGKTSADNIYTGVEGASQEGIYEYRTALGHLRVWVQPGCEADMLFTSDRSFNTDNYKYLYYSYSMRDVDSGIAAQENDNADTQANDNGFCIALKQAQGGSNTAYLEQEGEFVYYNSTTNYLDGNNSSVDRLSYSTTVSAAVDLSSLDNIDSINQIVVYMKNSTDSTAEFYLNYLILSNVQPSGAVSEELQETQVQYYYMMDDTGDRYSARYPTLDNPTGAVTGLTTDADRVNPIIVDRGAQLYEGTFFNGESLGSYTGKNDNNYTNQYTEFTVDDGVDGEIYKYIRQIWFYDTIDKTDDVDIIDYYQYREHNGDGTADKFDMVWSYGRWAGVGDSDLNTMYISKGTDDETEEYIYGNLVRRYATENYVLLRAGIEPKKFTTYFDANGGEFIYDGSSADVKNLDAVSENSYYINGTVLQGYFQDPATYAAMYDDGNEANGIDYIVKPGYTFSHWEHYESDGTKSEDFNTADTANPAKLWAYVKKAQPEVDYFVAVWTPNEDDAGKTNTATFYKNNTISDDNVLTTRETTNDELDLNGSYVFTFPKDVFVRNGSTSQRIYGWREVIETPDADGNVTYSYGDKVYGQGDKVYLLKDTKFVPEFDGTKVTTHKIKTFGARLYVRTTNGNLHPVESHDAKVAPIYGLDDNGQEDTSKPVGYEYTNVINQWSLVVLPEEAQDGSFWTAGTETDGHVYITEGTPTVLSDDINSYSFTALHDVSITYGSLELPEFHSKQDKIYVTTTAMNDPTSRELKLRTMFTTTNADVSIVACGTLVTKDSYINQVDLFEDMCLNTATVNSTTVEKGSYQSFKPDTVRLAQATARSELNEYFLRVTETKGQALTYYGRGYVIYQLAGNTEYHVAYSDVVAFTTLDAVQTT